MMIDLRFFLASWAIALTAMLTFPAEAASFDAATMDADLAAHEWSKLGPALSDPNAGLEEVNERDSWMRNSLRHNPNFLVAMILSRDEWAIASAATDPKRADELRFSSGANALLALAIVGIDGRRCEDETAPQHRSEQILQQRARSVAHLREALSSIQADAIRQVVADEARTAKIRDEESLVCSGGLSEITAGIARGTQVPMPTAPGTYGRTVGVVAPKGWQPTYLPENVSQPRQQLDRQQLAKSLGDFLRLNRAGAP